MSENRVNVIVTTGAQVTCPICKQQTVVGRSYTHAFMEHHQNEINKPCSAAGEFLYHFRGFPGTEDWFEVEAS